MNISAIDLQIRSLSLSSLYFFLKMLFKVLEKYQDFELVQSYLASFLNIHNETIWSHEYAQFEKENNQSNLLTDVKINLNFYFLNILNKQKNYLINILFLDS